MIIIIFFFFCHSKAGNIHSFSNVIGKYLTVALAMSCDSPGIKISGGRCDQRKEPQKICSTPEHDCR